MKRYAYSQHFGLVSLTPSVAVDEKDLIPIEQPKEASVFRIIFARDPITGRLRSDLGTYLTDETNPLVRDFIERQLRTDFSGQVVKTPEGISDSDIALLTRDRSETVDDYVKRVNAYCLQQRVNVQANQRKAAIRERIKSLQTKSE
jgi:hypothetical protein